jgi:hypothetical protein
MRSMKKAQTKKAPSPKRSPAAKRTSTVKPSAARAKSTPKVPPRRADFGAPIDGFFAKQPPPLRAILEALRKLVEEVAPEATASIKWGMPFYSVGGTMMCALGGHRSHVNLILAGPPGTFKDPEGRLEGEGKTGRHLTLRSMDDLPREAVRRWVKTALQLARAKG